MEILGKWVAIVGQESQKTLTQCNFKRLVSLRSTSWDKSPLKGHTGVSEKIMIPEHYKVKSCCSDCAFSGVNRIKVELGTHNVKDKNGNYFDVERDLPWDYFWDDQVKKIAAQVYCDAYRRSIQFPGGWLHCIKKMTQAEFEAQKEARNKAKR